MCVLCGQGPSYAICEWQRDCQRMHTSSDLGSVFTRTLDHVFDANTAVAIVLIKGEAIGAVAHRGVSRHRPVHAMRIAQGLVSSRGGPTGASAILALREHAPE